MSGWTAEAAAAHYRKLRLPPAETSGKPHGPECICMECETRRKPAPKAGPSHPYVVTSAPRTKKNSLRMMKRAGRMIPVASAAYCHWHERASGQAYRVKAEIRAAGIDLPITSRVNVAAVFYQDAAHRADECGYMQALGDWLQDVGIVEDDFWIHWNGVEIRIDRREPRIEFGVTL